MMNEMDLRQKMLEELMGQMDDRMASRVIPQSPQTPPMGGGDIPSMEMSMDEDDMTKRLRRAAMMQS